MDLPRHEDQEPAGVRGGVSPCMDRAFGDHHRTSCIDPNGLAGQLQRQRAFEHINGLVVRMMQVSRCEVVRWLGATTGIRPFNENQVASYGRTWRVCTR